MRPHLSLQGVSRALLWALVGGTILAGAGYLFLFAEAMSRDFSRRHLVMLLFNWQSQTAGAFALAAALLGAYIVHQQTAASQAIERSRLAREAAAVKARFPSLLADLETAINNSLDLYLALILKKAVVTIAVPDAMPLPGRTVEILSDYIKSAPEQHYRSVVILLRQLQIHVSREEFTRRRLDRGGGSPSRSLLLEYAVKSAEILARITELLLHARNDIDEPPQPITPDHLRTVFAGVVRTVVANSQLDEMMERMQQAAIEKGRIWPPN